MTQHEQLRLVRVADWNREAQRQLRLAVSKLCDETWAHEHLSNALKNLERSEDFVEQMLLAQ
jgi:hypothetical protein